MRSRKGRERRAPRPTARTTRGPFKGLSKGLSAQESIISELFQGKVVSCVRCLNCNQTSRTSETVYDVSAEGSELALHDFRARKEAENRAETMRMAPKRV